MATTISTIYRASVEWEDVGAGFSDRRMKEIGK